MICPHVEIQSDLKLSKLVLGCWRLLDQDKNFSISDFFQDALELGITSFDHADLYGDYQVEEAFGNAVSLKGSTREQVQIISKCGIQLISPARPDNQVKHYDYSSEYIIQSAERSIQKLGCDYLDVLLLHRPSPLLKPDQVAQAFDNLSKRGLVRYFGVSNFLPAQVDHLQSAVRQSLLFNQIEIHPFRLDSMQNGELDYLQQKEILPMAWSPTGQGRLFQPVGAKVLETLKHIAAECSATPGAVLYAWFAKHPAGILPVLGTVKKERMVEAVRGIDLELSLQQWFKIYESALGSEVP